MNNTQRILLFFALPTLSALLLPPQFLLQGLGVVLFVAAFFIAVGYFLMRGNDAALTFTIFLQGMNFIIRSMMFFSRTVSAAGIIDWAFAITSLISLGLSIYLLLRLDQVDIRAQFKH